MGYVTVDFENGSSITDKFPSVMDFRLWLGNAIDCFGMPVYVNFHEEER